MSPSGVEPADDIAALVDGDRRLGAVSVDALHAPLDGRGDGVALSQVVHDGLRQQLVRVVEPRLDRSP